MNVAQNELTSIKDRGYDGKLRLFRPDLNCNRLVMSATRVTLPPFDPTELEKILHAFLSLDGPRRDS